VTDLEPELVIRDAEVAGRRVDVAVSHGVIIGFARARSLRAAGDLVDARGGALIPGLHDHHIHLLALAAARQSLTFDDDFVTLARLEHSSAPPGAWLRVVGYHESILGEIDRAWLDDVVADRPLRVQHRTGAMWVLNSAALRAVGLASETGRLIGDDDVLRARWPEADLDLGAVGRELATYGVTGVSDLTPYADLGDMRHLGDTVRRAGLALRVMVTGGVALAGHDDLGLPRLATKIVVADHDLPSIESLVDMFRVARRHGRNVAVHCVTRIGLVIALAAWEEVGALPGDRIEHGAVIPLSLLPTIRDLGLCVVTQPSFVRDRGDAYLTDVDSGDIDDLWRCGSLLRAGVPVGGSTDAPFGDADPWQAIVTATDRTTAGGRRLGPGERIAAADALDAFLTPAHDPGGRPRQVVVGEIADLCLLGVPLGEALRNPHAGLVTATFVGGRPVFYAVQT